MHALYAFLSYAFLSIFGLIFTILRKQTLTTMLAIGFNFITQVNVQHLILFAREAGRNCIQNLHQSFFLQLCQTETKSIFLE